MNKFILIISLLFGLNANAGLISIELSDNQVNVGESITVNLMASDFNAFDTFDLDFNFNHNIFDYQEGSLTSDLTSVLPLVFETSENANGLAISFLDFAAFSTPNFLLASFEITATTEGEDSFSLSNVSFSDFFTPLTVDSSAQSAALVTASIPEPSTWLLFFSALLLVARANRSV